MTWTFSAFADEADETAEGQIAAITRAGMKYVDLRNVDGFNIAELPLDRAKQIKKLLDDAGVKCGMFGSPIGKIDFTDDFSIDQKKLRHLAELAKVIDCHAVRVFSYFNNGEAPIDQWQAEALDRLRKLGELADELGLAVYHENERHIFGDRVEQVLEIARIRDDMGAGKGPFRMVFDFDNYNQSDEDVWDAWQRLKDKTDAFHLKDSKKDKTHVPIGQGAGYAKQILADAKAAGWQGHLALEPHLMHSKAVMATGPGGKANEAFADMTTQDTFHAATGYAKDLLKEVGAQWE